MGFPGSSAGKKKSAYNAGDPGSIPGSGRSPREGIGYPLQYSWVSLVAQALRTPPAMWETWVQSLGWEDPLERGNEGNSDPLQYSCLENSLDRRAWQVTIHWVAKSRTQLTFTFHISLLAKRDIFTLIMYIGYLTKFFIYFSY